MIKRGELWWADLGEPKGSEPGYRRPVLVIQDNDFNKSKLATVIVLSLTTNLALDAMPGAREWSHPDAFHAILSRWSGPFDRPSILPFRPGGEP